MTTRHSTVDLIASAAGPVAALSFVGGVAMATALSDAPFPRPGASPEQVRKYFDDNSGPARVSIAGQLVSAVALGTFAAALAKMAERSRAGATVATAARIGAAVTVSTLTASALASLQLTASGVAASSRAGTWHKAVFVTGGPLHGPGIGLVMAALGMFGLKTLRIPKWQSYAALGTAAAGLAAPLALVAQPVVWLIPASRFPGLLLSAAAGVALARR